MPIKVTCSCGQALNAKDELAGKTVRCPKCKQPLTIPNPKAEAPAAKSAWGSQGPDPFAVGAGGLEGLFDEEGFTAAPKHAGPVCPSCGAAMEPNAMICIECGFNLQLGQRMAAFQGVETGGHDAHSSSAHALLARAEEEIRQTPLTQSDSDYGDGAQAYILAGVMVVGAVVMLGCGGLIMFIFDRLTQDGNVGRIAYISLFFGIIFLMAGRAWLTVVAFMENTTQGILCVCIFPLYHYWYAMTNIGTYWIPAAMFIFGDLAVVAAICIAIFAGGEPTV